MIQMKNKTSYVFGVLVIPDPPWILVHCMKENISSGFLSFLLQCKNRLGIAMEVTQVIASHFDWDIKYVWTANWGSQTNGSWNGAVGDVMSHKIDSVVPVVSPTFLRSEVVRFTGYMIMNQQYCFTYCYPLGRIVYFEWSKLFAQPVAMILLVAVFLFLTFIGLLIVSIPAEWRYPWKQACVRALNMIFSQISLISHRPSLIYSWKECIITGSLGLFSLFFFHFVRSKWMASFICKEPPPFKDVNDLAAKLATGDLRIVAEYPDKTFWKLLLKEYPKLGETVRKYPQNVFYRSQGYNPPALVLKNEHFVLFMKSVSSKWFISEYKKNHPELHHVHCITDHACTKDALADGFIVAMDQPMLYEQLTRVTRRLRQFGIVQKIEFGYGMNEMSMVERAQKREKPKVATTSLDFEGPPLQILAYGLAVSTLTFLTEFATFCLLADSTQKLQFMENILVFKNVGEL